MRGTLWLCVLVLVFGVARASDGTLPKPPLSTATATQATTLAPYDTAVARVAAQHAALVMEARRTEILGPYHPAHGEPGRAPAAQGESSRAKRQGVHAVETSSNGLQTSESTPTCPHRSCS